MANTILITANWHTGALSQQTISRQYDNNRYVVQFVGYPEASEDNELDYYLLVWMSSAPGETPDEIAPIQLASDQWYISNVFTQQTQQIKFQMCALNTEGTFEAHSPIFTGFVRNSLEHDGTTQDIDVSTLFDAYREYLNELIIRAGAVVIDSTLSQSGQAADAKAVGGALASLDAELIALRTFSNTGTDKTVWATNAVNLSADSDYYFCLIGYTGVNTEGLQYIVDIRNVYTSGSQLSTKIATAGELVKIRLDPSRTYTRTNIAFNRSADNPSSSTASSWTYAIFKGIPNRSRIADTLRNVALHGISAYTWENIAYYPSGAGWATTPDRISVRNLVPAQNLNVRAKDGYIFTVNYFDGNGNYLSRVLNVTHHTISADSHAGLTVYHADNSAIIPEDAQNAVILTYVAGEFGEHRYSGEKISLKKHSISMEQISFTVPNSVESYGVMQAGDMSGDTYAQAYGNYLQLYDFTAGTLSAEYPMNGGHANSMVFSNDYYDAGDDYPLLYVGAFNSPTVYINRITSNGVSTVDTLVFSASQTGYCTNVAIDPINKHLYMLGYSVNDPSQVSGNNIIVSKWDLGTVTDNGDNTHSPAFVKSFTLPVITYMQDCKYHGGKIFVLSGIGSDYPTKVYVIDVTGERIANIIDSFTTAISNSEKESIVINENDDYMLIGGFNGFYKIHF